MKFYRLDLISQTGTTEPLYDRDNTQIWFANLSAAESRANFERQQKHIPIAITEVEHSTNDL